MAATAGCSSSPAARCFLPPRAGAATQFRPSFLINPTASVSTRRSIGVPGLLVGSSSSADPLQRLGCSPTVAGRERRRNWRPAAFASLGGNEDEADPVESVSTNPDLVARIDLKLPRRRLLVQFTCNECGERTSRLVNPLAYERGLVYVQCAGCLRHHKLVDNLGLVMEYDMREETNVKLDADS